MRGVFITGTDTGVGKTQIARHLVAILTTRGMRVRVRKPVESGCIEHDGERIPADGTALREAAGAIESLDQVCPFRLRAAISPERAAVLEGKPINLDDLHQACLAGVEEDDFLVVEGAGGFYSPLAENTLNADLAQRLGLAVLLVVGDRLGCLNHALLSAEAIASRGLALAAIVLNRYTDDRLEGMDNVLDLKTRLAVPLFVTPYADTAGHRSGAYQELADSLTEWQASTE